MRSTLAAVPVQKAYDYWIMSVANGLVVRSKSSRAKMADYDRQQGYVELRDLDIAI